MEILIGLFITKKYALCKDNWKGQDRILVLKIQKKMFTLSLIMSSLPSFIFLIAWLLYLIKKKTTLSIVLFASSFYLTLANLLQTYLIAMPHDFRDTTNRMQLMSSIGMVTNLVHFVYAIAFFIFIKRIIEPKEAGYQFLDDSKTENNGDLQT